MDESKRSLLQGSPESSPPPPSSSVVDENPPSHEPSAPVGIGFELAESVTIAPPPLQPAATQPGPSPVADYTLFLFSLSKTSIPRISEDEARQALLEMVSSHCCYGKTAARELIFTNITSSSAFHYQLETFSEGRQTVWEHEPFNGQPIDDPQNGHAPQPWSILALPDQQFRNHRKHFEIPHTASVRSCHNCRGGGYIKCHTCHGSTTVQCHSCHGSGHRTEFHDHHHHHHHGNRHHGHHHHHHVSCYSCHGSGRIRCCTCEGRGSLECEVCLTRGQLKRYLKLTVTWTNHKDEEVVERTSLPDHLITTAQGVTAVQDHQTPMVLPLTGFPDSQVNTASQNLVNRHSTAWPNEKILMQRQTVRVVPVAEVASSWNSKTFSYFVYGEDRQVHAPAYPQKCCWGCVLL